MKKKKEIIEDGIKFDSWEEVYFYWWCKELKTKGFIEEIILQPDSFILSHKVVSSYIKKLKTKDKIIDEPIMQGNEYTTDSLLTWTEKARDIFFTELSGHTRKKDGSSFKYILSHGLKSMVEVKPIFDQNNMTRLAKINIKWVYKDHGVYINLIIPEKLFEKTFTPLRYIYCNLNSKQRRKIKYKNVVLLDEFLKNFN